MTCQDFITQEKLKELLSYNQDTGAFLWIKAPKNHGQLVGKVAGSIDKYGYLIIKIDGVRYKSHRLAWLYMTGVFPESQIDHINHLHGDNRFFNLREAANNENMKNRPFHSNNKSGVTGVCWNTAESSWDARIGVNGKSVYLGRYENLIDAGIVRYVAERRYNFHLNHGVNQRRKIK